MILTTENITPIPGRDHVIMMIVTTMIETDMTGDVQMTVIEIEKTVSAMKNLTAAGPGIEMIIMTMIKIGNGEGSTKMEIAHNIMMISSQIEGKSRLRHLKSAPFRVQ
jgi:hypothetical protein